MVLLFAARAGTHAQATCDTTWIAESGVWDDPINWSNGPPGPEVTACVTSAATLRADEPVLLDGGFIVAPHAPSKLVAFEVPEIEITGRLGIGGDAPGAVLASLGPITNRGALVLEATATIKAPSVYNHWEGTIEVNGTAAIESGAIVQNDGVLRLTADVEAHLWVEPALLNQSDLLLGNGSLLETSRLEIRSGSWIQVAGRAGIERGGDDPLVLDGTITVEPREGVRGYLGISGAIESNTAISLTDSVLEVDGLLSRGGLSFRGDSTLELRRDRVAVTQGETHFGSDGQPAKVALPTLHNLGRLVVHSDTQLAGDLWSDGEILFNNSGSEVRTLDVDGNARVDGTVSVGNPSGLSAARHAEYPLVRAVSLVGSPRIAGLSETGTRWIAVIEDDVLLLIAARVRAYSLQSGSNQIAYLGPTLPVAEVLGEIAPSIERIWSLRNGAGGARWLLWDPSLPAFLQGFTELEIGQPYFLIVREPVLWSVAVRLESLPTETTLSAGANSLTFMGPSIDLRDAEQVALYLPEVVESIWQWDALHGAWKSWHRSLPPALASLTLISTQKPYIFIASDAVAWPFGEITASPETLAKMAADDTARLALPSAGWLGRGWSDGDGEDPVVSADSPASDFASEVGEFCTPPLLGAGEPVALSRGLESYLHIDGASIQVVVAVVDVHALGTDLREVADTLQQWMIWNLGSCLQQWTEESVRASGALPIGTFRARVPSALPEGISGQRVEVESNDGLVQVTEMRIIIRDHVAMLLFLLATGPQVVDDGLAGPEQIFDTKIAEAIAATAAS